MEKVENSTVVEAATSSVEEVGEATVGDKGNQSPVASSVNDAVADSTSTSDDSKEPCTTTLTDIAEAKSPSPGIKPLDDEAEKSHSSESDVSSENGSEGSQGDDDQEDGADDKAQNQNPSREVVLVEEVIVISSDDEENNMWK